MDILTRIFECELPITEMKKIVKYISLVLVALVTTGIYGQDQGFIYGEVSTIDGNKYEGQIRWGKEEAYWHDIFNATKTSNEHFKYLSSSEKKDATQRDWGSIDWRIISIWSDEYSNVLHQFSCRFGDISSIEVTGRNRLMLTLKDDSYMELSGGSNDVGTSVHVMDSELGEVKIRWDRIDRVVFKETPKKLSERFGKPLYGEVETRQNGKFEGYIQWDHDERMSQDKLDGKSKEGNMSIAFEKIAKIRNEGNSSYVELQSGRSMMISGTNDVNTGNRGIIVSMDEVGRVDIPWNEFKEVTFEESKGSGQSYRSYGKPSKLEGKVVTQAEVEYTGIIVFDIDEALDIELIQGKDDQVEYIIPIRNINKITPRNYNYSTVELRNGSKVLIGDSQDVSERNSGVLIFEKGAKAPIYVAWKKVSEIIFE